MAKNNKIIAGIEIGSSKIVTIIAQVATEPATQEISVNIVGVAATESKGIKKGQIVDIEEAVEATIASVEAAERMAGYNLDSAFVAVGGAHIHSQNSHGVVAISDPEGEVGQDDVDRVIEAASAISLPQSREVLHVIPREYIVDGESQVMDPIGMSGVRLEVETHIVTGAAPALKNLKKALGEVGIEIDGLVYSGLAASYAVLSPTERELGCVLVDIGGGTTSIACFIDGSLAFSSVLPIGAKNVTNDLAIGLRLSLESAEKVKLALSRVVKKGEESDEIDIEDVGADSTKRVSKRTLTEGIIKPRLNEIFTMVRLELEREDLATKIPSGVVLAGGGGETIGALDSAKRMLSLPARIGKPVGVTGLIDDIMTPAFASPIGVILYATKAVTPENQSSFARKIKLPSKGTLGRLFEAVKDLLP